MPLRPGLRSRFAGLALLLGLGGGGFVHPVEGQAQEPAAELVPSADQERPGGARTGFVANPVLARGSLLFEFGAGAQSVRRVYEGDGERSHRPGGFLFVPGLGVDDVPGLEPAEDRLQALAGEPGAPRLRLGSTRGRFSANEQELPMRLSYGVVDRLTVGVTVPVVRRRVDALLRLSPDGANVGRNPADEDGSGVPVFLSGSQTALAELQAAVDAWCAEAGEGDPECQSGRTLAEEFDSFLAALSTAYSEEAFFPLANSDLGGLLAARWTAVRDGAAGWDAEAPDTLPLATRGMDDETFRSQVLEPAWGPTGFPGETPRAFLLLGDVEAHVAVALLNPDPGDHRGAVRIRSSLVGTVRFPTGTPDSLRTVAPLDPPRGVGAVELKSVSDILLPGRFAALAVVEVGRWGTRDLTLLAPDPARPFVPGATRAQVRWTPGDHLRIALTPRFHLHRSLSLGAGWSYLARGPDRYESLDPAGAEPFGPDRGPRLHHLSLELRFAALEPPASESMLRPLEVMIRGSRTVSGSGPFAPVEQRIQFGGRLTLKR
jgi:hypothetical protein